jgi:riboflavin synthase
VVEKGSVTLDGVSLTVSRLLDGRLLDGRPADGQRDGDEGSAPAGPAFEVALIPHTLEVTNLERLEPGDRVHFEVDILAKYVERALATSGALAR